MVKLLVVDDEITSRDSLIRNIMKMDFDISFIEQADDGIRALEIAAWYCPDIVLTDVRMPRMDGIEMSFKLKESFPDTKIIFMSGYSDKEYLKSAIQLRALSYIEKPIDYNELKDILGEAINLLILEHKNRENAVISERLSKNFPLLRNELAIKLTNPYKLINEQFDYTLLGIQPQWDFVTSLIQIINKNSLTPFGFYSAMENTINNIDNILKSKGLVGISTIKDNEYILIHIACPPDKKHLLESGCIKEYLKNVENILMNIDFFIAVGKQVSGIRNVPQSYNSAVLTLKKGFFNDYRTTLFYSENTEIPFTFNEDIIKDINEMILAEEAGQAVSLIRALALDLKQYGNTLPNNIKEFFYRIILLLYDLSSELGLETFSGNSDRSRLWQDLSNFYTLNEVEEYCCRKIEFFFQCRREKRDSKSKILQIKRFIENNYMNSDLSIKMISEHTYLSLAYMCSIFKQETGDTINQHITDYRIEKAKEMLKNRNHNISHVAESVGFNDSQYFAKIFKKKTGLTPTEFKEMCHK